MVQKTSIFLIYGVSARKGGEVWASADICRQGGEESIFRDFVRTAPKQKCVIQK